MKWFQYFSKTIAVKILLVLLLSNIVLGILMYFQIQRINDIHEQHSKHINHLMFVEFVDTGNKIHNTYSRTFELFLNKTIKKQNVMFSDFSFELYNNNIRGLKEELIAANRDLTSHTVDNLEVLLNQTIKKRKRDLVKIIKEIQQKEEKATDKILSRIKSLSIFIIIFGFVLMTGILILGFRKFVITPIERLTRATKSIASGTLDTVVAIKSKDELGQLASFNHMAENLFKTTVSKDYVDSILKSMMEMLMVLNPDGTIKLINQAVKEILGYKENEIINKQFGNFITGKEEEGKREESEKVREEGEAEKEKEEEEAFRDIAKLNAFIQEGAIKEFRVFVKSKSGARIPVILSGSILRDKENILIGVILLIKDARDSRLLKELKDTQYQLIQSGKLAALGEMSSGLAHEINNPLFLIKGFNNRIKVELSKYNKDAYEKVYDYVREVDENSQRIMKIVKHFREFSRQAEHDFTPILINDVVSKSFILLNEQLKLHSIDVKQNLTTDDTKIMGNSNQLEQVFINIITNARDAITDEHGSKGGEIVVCTRTEGKSAIVEFTDNGNGVDDEELSRIFDPFYTTKEVGKGTGLGLSISHGIVTDHKGQISCKSKRGEGSSFIVRLPFYHDIHT